MRRGIEADAPEVAGAAGVDAADAAGRRTQQGQHAERVERVHGGFGEAEVALVEHRGQRAGGLASTSPRPGPAAPARSPGWRPTSPPPTMRTSCAWASGAIGALRYATGSAPPPASRPHESPPRFASRPGPLVLAALIFVAALSRCCRIRRTSRRSRRWRCSAARISRAGAGPDRAAGGDVRLRPGVLGLANGGIYWDYFASAGYLLVYACIALSTLLGFGLRGKR